MVNVTHEDVFHRVIDGPHVEDLLVAPATARALFGKSVGNTGNPSLSPGKELSVPRGRLIAPVQQVDMPLTAR